MAGRKPGQKGTLREYQKYGEDLLAVRYRNNDQGLVIKTVEIIVSISKAEP
ncbi:hypothetical protein Gbem_4126 [Citrifermentans bemidjiense Bem]|uniref:Uncharacterized protein n=1 Tax=Citrifermentans bemidjiense (strain ATCC BAA-1014 / DSM 16622 / JCM 12645 / Bem) TaxID=404380 RepID=E1P6C8_CITBB|nr:hypothetical protein [Citrifermentans bemidjiense]ADO00823.1 hypothetical protein Gbem_4126 [Citrifermentans bemidjiense Bem]